MTARYGKGIACITVNYYSSEALQSLIESLTLSSSPVDKLLVVNNAVDDELEGIRPLEGVTIMEAGRNAGYGTAVNLAASSLEDSIGWILVANPDVMVDSDAVSVLLATAKSSPRIGAVGPRITDEDGTVYPSARELPSLRTGIGHALFANIWPGNPWSHRYHGVDRPVMGTSRQTGWLSGAFLLIRREAFVEIGGFDDGYFMYFEDVDFGSRLAGAGWISVHETAATVIHSGAHSTKRAAAAMNRAHHASAYRYLTRKYSSWWQWPLRAVLRLALAIRERFTSGRTL